MKYYKILCFTLIAILAGCDQKPPAPPLPPKVRLIESAKSIASDPSNWKGNSKMIVELSTSSIELGWTDKEEVRNFKAAAIDLIAFSTTWIDKLDSVESKKFTDGWAKIAATIDSKIPSAANAVKVKIEEESHEKQAESILASSTIKLQANQAEQFGKLWSRLIDSYEKLCVLANKDK